MNGIIIKGIGGFYYISTDNGIFECKARGIFRKRGIIPMVGDRVIIDGNPQTMKGVINEIEDRTNQLARPAVANITQAAVVIAVASPSPNYSVLDKIIANCVKQSLKIIICVNKIDLAESHDVSAVYKNTGYPVVTVSAEQNYNIDSLADLLKDEITVFAGNSGVGKSSVLNCISDNFALKTGSISEKIERGRHTTRHVELLTLSGGGYVIDTPGFSSLDVSGVTPGEVKDLFAEFEDYNHLCRFNGCNHVGDKGCAVFEAVENGKIARSRYESYLEIHENVKNIKLW